MLTRSRKHGINDTPLRQRMDEDETALVETIQQVVKEELAAHEIVIK